jgi:hypothetical protein
LPPLSPLLFLKSSNLSVPSVPHNPSVSSTPSNLRVLCPLSPPLCHLRPLRPLCFLYHL